MKNLPKNENSIILEGHSQLRIQPDTVVISCRVSALNLSCTKANRDLNRRTELLRQSLAESGLEKTDFKTVNFGVARQTQQDPKTQKQLFTGYLAHHCLELRLPLDKKQLDRVLDGLTDNDADAHVSLKFVLADQQPVSERLLAAAVKNARERAEIIARAAGVRLGKITSIIKHGHMDIRDLNMPGLIERERAVVKIEAGDLTVKESVAMTWEILQ